MNTHESKQNESNTLRGQNIVILCKNMFMESFCVESLNYYNMYDLRLELALSFFYLRYVTAREKDRGS